MIQSFKNFLPKYIHTKYFLNIYSIHPNLHITPNLVYIELTAVPGDTFSSGEYII